MLGVQTAILAILETLYFDFRENHTFESVEKTPKCFKFESLKGSEWQLFTFQAPKNVKFNFTHNLRSRKFSYSLHCEPFTYVSFRFKFEISKIGLNKWNDYTRRTVGSEMF